MFLEVGTWTAHIQIDAPLSAPAGDVVLLHSLGTTLHVWDPQTAVLARRLRVK
jgi:3-oxoadipate enol-lactonase/4-carboxymuconolactone decarboxylase